ncbi:hypothetical protein COR50_13365 [Chitinophaga caeni]|uniref:Uncharacterized protein n=2 Tax=Chitinophaga caeni TaxID=2029983 RepID=A0A291QW42_9BACT|nr:hypothetical protein COR50_13365 [Chitinophaga caeni]
MSFNIQSIIMRKYLFLLLALVVVSRAGFAQGQIEQHRQFTGAKAGKSFYKAIYQLDTNVPGRINKAIRNINNLLNDPRLKGKIEVELVAFSKGTDAYLKNSGFEKAFRELAEKGVIIAQCENTMRERKLSKDQLYDFVAYVPSGNGELVIRGSDGWVIVKP